MNIDKEKLAEFIRAMKRGHSKKALNNLFVVDVETNEVYACALGRGLINIGEVTEETIKQDALAEAIAFDESIVIDGIKQHRKVFCPTDLNSQMDDWLAEKFGQIFTGWVAAENDNYHMKSISEIGMEAFERFLTDA